MMVPLNVLNAIYFICRYVKFQRREIERRGCGGLGGGGEDIYQHMFSSLNYPSITVTILGEFLDHNHAP